MRPRLPAPFLRLNEIAHSLDRLDPKDASFVLVENLFFEALSITRDHSEDLKTAMLYNELIQLKENDYKRTQEYYKSIKVKEGHIKHFKSNLKKALRKCIAMAEAENK